MGDPSTPDGVGFSTRFPKLSNQQWENSVTDAFYLTTPSGFSSAFVHEPADQGYEAEAAAPLTISGDAWSRYQSAAEQVADLVTKDEAKFAKILPANLPSDGDAKATAAIKAIGRRLYRRPLTSSESDAYLALFKQAPTFASGDAFHVGINLTIQTMLQSPHFLYRVERTQGTSSPLFLDSYEMATRLSYALWNTTPSDDLLDAADRAELATKDGVLSWAQKMVADPRAKDVLLSFHEQMFGTSLYGTQSKDPKFGFDATALAPALIDEPRQFFDEIVLQQNKGIRELLTTPIAFVNASTAPLYGLSGVTGTDLTRVALDPGQRAGLFTQIGFLSQNAGRVLTDPVHRGLTVLRKVLCDEPDPPPAMFMPPTPEAGKTTRQIYEAKTACGVGCHDILINPAGFAFEHFDAVGAYRETENGLTIDAKSTLRIRDGWTQADKEKNPYGSITFDGAVDLSKQLADLPRTHECYSRQFLEFVLSRPVDPVEQGIGATLRDKSLAGGSARDILATIVTLNAFRARVPDAP
ncbi:MAG TPA: DUF1592 domain-containing protein [Polyangiaceae bacterium]|nr:DUF1592 domain-containing protein [Polyangiaceae bacterium]